MFRNLNAPLLAALLSALSLASAAQEPTPDFVLYNGKIFTSNAAHPYVQALAIRGDRITATGGSAKIKSLAGPRTKEIDLGGRTVIPGINDAHLHLDIHPANWVELQTQGPDPTWNELKSAILKAPDGAGLMADIGLEYLLRHNRKS